MTPSRTVSLVSSKQSLNYHLRVITSKTGESHIAMLGAYSQSLMLLPLRVSSLTAIRLDSFVSVRQRVEHQASSFVLLVPVPEIPQVMLRIIACGFVEKVHQLDETQELNLIVRVAAQFINQVSGSAYGIVTQVQLHSSYIISLIDRPDSNWGLGFGLDLINALDNAVAEYKTGLATPSSAKGVREIAKKYGVSAKALSRRLGLSKAKKTGRRTEKTETPTVEVATSAQDEPKSKVFFVRRAVDKDGKEIRFFGVFPTTARKFTSDESATNLYPDSDLDGADAHRDRLNAKYRRKPTVEAASAAA